MPIHTLVARAILDRALVIASVCALGPTVALAEPVYVYAAGQLALFETESGVAEEIGEAHDPELSFDGLDYGPDGRLYGVAGTPLSLYRIDTASGDLTELGSTGIDMGLQHPIVFDSSGMLWLAAAQTLYQVDPTNGTASIAAVLPEPKRFTALAALNDQVYAITENLDTEVSSLEELDLETFLLTERFPLDLEGIVLSATFDRQGGLRFVERRGGVIAVVPLSFYVIQDLETPAVVETYANSYHFAEPLAQVRAIAGLAGGAAPLDVPVLNDLGRVLLAILILVSGLAALRVGAR